MRVYSGKPQKTFGIGACCIVAAIVLALATLSLQAQAQCTTAPAGLYATAAAGTELITIDLAGQSASKIGDMDTTFAFALAFSPSGIGYTVTDLFTAASAQLACVDGVSGHAYLVGNPLASSLPPNTSLQMMGVTVSPEGIVYGAAMPATAIYNIDTGTGAATLIGSTAMSKEIMSFAYDTDGTLYAASCCASPNTLYEVDLASGTATPVLSISLPSMMGIAIDADGALYASDFVACSSPGQCSSIYRIDRATGAVTKLFTTPFAKIHNIAFSPGTPAQQLAALEQRINGLGLLPGIATSFDAKVSAALDAVNAGNNTTACNILGAFQNEVDALAGSRLITDSGVRQLDFANLRLHTALACQ